MLKLDNLIVSLLFVSSVLLLIDLCSRKYKDLFKGNLKTYTVISVPLSIAFIGISIFFINHFYGGELNVYFDKNTPTSEILSLISMVIYMLLVVLPSISLLELICDLVHSKKEISKMMYEHLNDLCHEETKQTIDAFGMITIEQAFEIEYKVSLQKKEKAEEVRKANSAEQQIKNIKQKIRDQK